MNEALTIELGEAGGAQECGSVGVRLAPDGLPFVAIMVEDETDCAVVYMSAVEAEQLASQLSVLANRIRENFQ